MKDEIKKDITSIDPNAATDLSVKVDEILKAYKSKNKIKDMTNKNHAPIFGNVLEIFEVLHEHK